MQPINNACDHVDGDDGATINMIVDVTIGELVDVIMVADTTGTTRGKSIEHLQGAAEQMSERKARHAEILRRGQQASGSGESVDVTTMADTTGKTRDTWMEHPQGAAEQMSERVSKKETYGRERARKQQGNTLTMLEKQVGLMQPVAMLLQIKISRRQGVQTLLSWGCIQKINA